MSQAESILKALGGWENIADLEACITRIRVDVRDDDAVDEAALKDAGAFGVVKVGNSHAVAWAAIAQYCLDTRAQQACYRRVQFSLRQLSERVAHARFPFFSVPLLLSIA